MGADLGRVTIANLERVMWRLRTYNKVLNNIDLRKAICEEIGTDVRTYNNNKTTLVLLGWIQLRKRGHHIILTNKDLTRG